MLIIETTNLVLKHSALLLLPERTSTLASFLVGIGTVRGICFEQRLFSSHNIKTNFLDIISTVAIVLGSSIPSFTRFLRGRPYVIKVSWNSHVIKREVIDYLLVHEVSALRREFSKIDLQKLQ